MNYIKKILKLKKNDDIIKYIDNLEYEKIENLIDNNNASLPPGSEQTIIDIFNNRFKTISTT
uniref:ORF F3R n=1 Tax=Heliothis armigera entomopoxvirus TaxID=10290 RepID=O37321_HAEPV|nr:ORF F3R [Heliothis armigera entomopoxvirus]